MKDIKLRRCNGVDLNKIFSAKLVGGSRGYDDALALETYSNTCAPTLRTITGFIVVAQIIDKDMKQRDFHRQCRVVYRACRRLYGTEKVQDECLKVFKVVFPFLHKARNGEDYQFDDLARERVKSIFEVWNPITFSSLDILTCKIKDSMKEPMEREDFIKFCEDILVVVMRIRKLTPRECGRLMDVDDKDLDVMLNCGVSKSALYKLFGNSIVEACLFHIFRKLFIETEPDIVKGEPIQLSLF